MKDIIIYATSDIHANIKGVKQKESFITSLKDKKAHNSIVIDNGDFFVGSTYSAFFYYKDIDYLSQKAKELFDVVVVGNHDLDFGVEYLKEIYDDIICANIYDLDFKRIFSPYKTFTKMGKNILVIGVITKALPQIQSYSITKDIIVRDVIEELKEIISELRDDFDYIVVSYHGGIERDMKDGRFVRYDTGEDQAYRIIDEVKGIDALICGHQHQSDFGVLQGVNFVQPDYGAYSYGLINLTKKESKLVYTREYREIEFKYLDEYNKWMDEKIDLKYFSEYLDKNFKYDLLDIKFKGETRKDFSNSFSKPYSFLSYILSYDEVKEYKLKFKEKKDKYLILSNTNTLPYYRITKQHINDVFNEYHKFIKEL